MKKDFLFVLSEQLAEGDKDCLFRARKRGKKPLYDVSWNEAERANTTDALNPIPMCTYSEKEVQTFLKNEQWVLKHELV